MKKTEAPATRATSQNQPDTKKPATKIKRVLTYLVTKGSINRLEAEKPPVFDHSLNSTMSNEIKQRLKLEFSSIPEKTIGYDGLGAIYHRYSLTEHSTEAAKRIINDYRTKRGADPIQWESAA